MSPGPHLIDMSEMGGSPIGEPPGDAWEKLCFRPVRHAARRGGVEGLGEVSVVSLRPPSAWTGPMHDWMSPAECGMTWG